MTDSIRGGSVSMRVATREDRDALLAAYRLCEDFLALGPQPQASMAMILDDLERSQQEGGSFCGIHDAAGRMIGVADFAVGRPGGEPGAAFISLVMLVPGVRCRGVGTEVVRLIEREILKDPRVTMIGSAVQVNNPDAQRFWVRQGYRVTGEPQPQSDGTTVLRLRKDCREAR